MSSAAAKQAEPALAWNGRDFLVVWTEQRRHRESDLYTARVSATGAIRDGTGIPIDTEPGGQWDAAVGWNGRHFLVTWTASGPDGEGVYGARIDARGRVLDPGRFAITTSSEGRTGGPRVTSDGRDFLVVWAGDGADGRGVFAARVSHERGRIRHIGPISRQSPGTNAGQPAVAWNGQMYLVVWTAFTQPATFHIAGARVSRSGRVLDPIGIDIASGSRPQTEPALASSGTTFFVAWSDNIWDTARVQGVRVDKNGRVLDPAAIVLDQDRPMSFDSPHGHVVRDELPRCMDSRPRHSRSTSVEGRAAAEHHPLPRSHGGVRTRHHPRSVKELGDDLPPLRTSTPRGDASLPANPSAALAPREASSIGGPYRATCPG